MNTQTKAILKSGLFSGIVYAGLMSGFDYSESQDFRICRFILDALFFGTFMGFISRYNLKRSRQRNK